MTRRSLRVAALVATLPVVVGGEAPQDGAAQGPTFRANVESVDVDVVVTDGDDTFVRGLTPEDFEVYEDGQRQEVRTFSLVDLPTSAAPADAGGATDALAGEGRRFIMILNEFGPRLARIAWQFVDTALGPNDEMAIYHNHPINNAFVEGVSFTSSKPRLRAVIRRIEPAFRPFQPAPQTLRSLNQGELADLRLRAELEKYEMLQRAMSEIGRTPGRRKAVLWFGGGFPLNRSGIAGLQLALAYRDVVRTAARHHVVIYPIDPRGLTTRTGARELARMAGYRALGEDTGGEGIVGTNDFAKGYARIVREMSTYYLLGYYPQVAHRDGKFHSIRVRVKKPGVKVRARKGYYADEPIQDAPPVFGPPAAIDAALGRLADSVSVIDSGRSPLGEPVFWRRGPLPRDSYARTADPRFTRQERLRLELRSDNEAPVTASLLDRTGARLPVTPQVSERTDPSGGPKWVVVDVTLAPFAQGDYVVELVQGDAVRTIAFKVVP